MIRSIPFNDVVMHLNVFPFPGHLPSFWRLVQGFEPYPDFLDALLLLTFPLSALAGFKSFVHRCLFGYDLSFSLVFYPPNVFQPSFMTSCTFFPIINALVGPTKFFVQGPFPFLSEPSSTFFFF